MQRCLEKIVNDGAPKQGAPASTGPGGDGRRASPRRLRGESPPPVYPSTALNPPPPKPIRCLALNARSLKKVSPAGPSLLLLSHALDADEFDMFMACETWFDESISTEMILNSATPGYQVFRRDRNAAGGGVVLIIKQVCGPVGPFARRSIGYIPSITYAGKIPTHFNL